MTTMTHDDRWWWVGEHRGDMCLSCVVEGVMIFMFISHKHVTGSVTHYTVANITPGGFPFSI